MDTPVIAGKYAVIRRLASGGMAEVFLAKHCGIDGFEKLVVLKRILPHLARQKEYVQMFLDEARTVADLRHANIVATFEVGSDNGMYFMVMEYLNGQDLRSVFKAWRQQQSSPNLIYATGIIMDACSGLHYAHTKKNLQGKTLHIVHRDVSPQNIVVTYEGAVKILDFGIAQASHQTWQTKSGVLKGKCSYMSPEQALGEALDARSDIFSLGIILYELSTLQRLFRRENEVLTCRAIVDGDIPLPSIIISDFPRGLQQIIMKALARKAADRFASAEEFRDALDEFHSQMRWIHSSHKLGHCVQELFKQELELGSHEPNDHYPKSLGRAEFWPTNPYATLPAKSTAAAQEIEPTRERINSLFQILGMAIFGGVLGVILVLATLSHLTDYRSTKNHATRGALAVDFDQFKNAIKTEETKR